MIPSSGILLEPGWSSSSGMTLKSPYWDPYYLISSSLIQINGIECILSKFTGDIKLTGAVYSLEGRDGIQKVSDRPEEWTQENLMKLNKD